MQLKPLASGANLFIFLFCVATACQGQVPKPDPEPGDPPPQPGRRLDPDVTQWRSDTVAPANEKKEPIKKDPDRKDPDPNDPPGPKA